MTESVDGTITQRLPLRQSGLAVLFLRLALGFGFASAVADRLGIWGPPGTPLVSWGNFHSFLVYTAKLNPWCPASCLPLLGVLVTVAEAGLGILLILGFLTRMAGFLTGALSLIFAVSMTFVLGVHAPLNYSVFAFSAGSFLLASQRPDGLSIDQLLVSKRTAHGRKPGLIRELTNI